MPQQLRPAIDLSKAVIAVPPGLSRREQNAVRMLVEEIEKRTLIRLPQVVGLPSAGTAAIWVSRWEALPEDWKARLASEELPAHAEGYLIRPLTGTPAPLIVMAGADERGVLFGAGRLLRALELERYLVSLPADFSTLSWPQVSLRGHQLGYRDKTNSYDAWDLRQWDQYIRELAIFGANAIELIPPRSDDAHLLDSMHFPLPPMETMVGMSQIADDYGLDLWIWYPAMDEDYSDPATVVFALQEWGEVFRRLPRIDHIFVPGGDPGKAPPHDLIPMLARQQMQLVRYHPNAKMWISPQGFTGEWMAEFLGILRDESPSWLYGVVHGPWIHIPMAEFRAMIPEQYALRNYPDITHSLNCQFPVPDWDIAFALTEGRETINPRPLDAVAIFKATLPGTIGFLTYSEGCNDDVNKMVWSGLGWDPDRPVIETLREYGRFFIGRSYAEPVAQALLALERHWRGPLLSNTLIPVTLQQVQALENSARPQVLQNWRFLQLLYRAYYDAYVRARLIYETCLEEQSWEALRGAGAHGTLRAFASAEEILDRAIHQPVARDLRTRIFQLAEALFQSPAHMQLSVHLYQGQEEVRGANLDGIDYPLNDAPWIRQQLADARMLPGEPAQLKRIDELLNWCNPGPGGVYINLGSGHPSPYVVPGLSYEQDPNFLKSPIRKYPYRKLDKTVRLAWRGFTGTLNDQPLQLHFPDLDPQGGYRLIFIYSEGQSHHAPVMVRLDAGNGIEIHPYRVKPSEFNPLEYEIPASATCGGDLTLTWQREPGKGGIGLGCDLCEVWLIRTR
jgi:hypothetical protein